MKACSGSVYRSDKHVRCFIQIYFKGFIVEHMLSTCLLVCIRISVWRSVHQTGFPRYLTNKFQFFFASDWYLIQHESEVRTNGNNTQCPKSSVAKKFAPSPGIRPATLGLLMQCSTYYSTYSMRALRYY